VRGIAALGQGRGEDARAAFQQMADMDLTDVEALRNLTMTLAVYGGVHGWDRDESVDVDRRLMAVDSTDDEPVVREMRRALGALNVGRVDSLLARLEHMNVADFDRTLNRLSGLVAHGRTREAMALVHTFDDPEMVANASDPFLAVGDLEDAIGVWHALDAPKFPPTYRLYARIRAAWFEMSRGRWSVARTDLARAREINSGIADLYEALMTCSLPRLERADHDRVRAALSRDRMSEEQFAGTTAGSLYQQIEGSWTATRLYGLGLLDAAYGDRDSAEAACRALRRLDGSDLEKTWAEIYAGGIEARLFSVQGRRTEALGRIERLSSQSQFGLRVGLRTLTAERSLRLKLLTELGRPGEALRWMSYFPLYYFDHVAGPELTLLKARSLGKAGRAAEARAEYERIVRRLDRPDSLYLPLLDEARARLRSASSS
jgi:tetratricopeptide (TPR) repeat protein